MTGTYLLSARAIAEITEYDSTNANDVAWVTDKVDLSNRQIENDLSDVFDTFPTDSTTALWKSFADAALYFFQYLWYKKIGNNEQSKLANALYTSEITTLQKEAKSILQLRTERVVVHTDYDTETTILPSQINYFV